MGVTSFGGNRNVLVSGEIAHTLDLLITIGEGLSTLKHGATYSNSLSKREARCVMHEHTDKFTARRFGSFVLQMVSIFVTRPIPKIGWRLALSQSFDGS